MIHHDTVHVAAPDEIPTALADAVAAANQAVNAPARHWPRSTSTPSRR